MIDLLSLGLGAFVGCVSIATITLFFLSKAGIYDIKYDKLTRKYVIMWSEQK